MATPYAAGLSTLVDDEAELGAAVVDFGGGSTTVGVFSGGRLIHVDAVALGGIARDEGRRARSQRCASATPSASRRLYGACIASPSDDRETITVHRLGDDQDHPSHLPKSELVRIIRPRVEEILELVRDRLKASGYAAQAGRRLVMTGGACQLTGLPELARTIALEPGPRRTAARRSRACRNPARARPSPPRSASWSIRRWPASNISEARARTRIVTIRAKLAMRRGSDGGSRTVFKARKRRSPKASAWVKGKHAFQSAPAGVQPMRLACRSI